MLYVMLKYRCSTHPGSISLTLQPCLRANECPYHEVDLDIAPIVISTCVERSLFPSTSMVITMMVFGPQSKWVWVVPPPVPWLLKFPTVQVFVSMLSIAPA